MKIQLLSTPFDLWLELQTYQNEHSQFNGKYGAANVFVGTMRDFNQNNDVKSMVLEHYPEMTSKYLHQIATEALEKWDILDVLMLHRYGKIEPNDSIVLLATWSTHRDAAFAACRYLIEELKNRAPFWKKETLLADNSGHWVEKNTPNV